MSSPIVGGMLAFFGGCAASALNFWINLTDCNSSSSI